MNETCEITLKVLEQICAVCYFALNADKPIESHVNSTNFHFKEAFEVSAIISITFDFLEGKNIKESFGLFCSGISHNEFMLAVALP